MRTDPARDSARPLKRESEPGAAEQATWSAIFVAAAAGILCYSTWRANRAAHPAEPDTDGHDVPEDSSAATVTTVTTAQCLTSHWTAWKDGFAHGCVICSVCNGIFISVCECLRNKDVWHIMNLQPGDTMRDLVVT